MATELDATKEKKARRETEPHTATHETATLDRRAADRQPVPVVLAAVQPELSDTENTHHQQSKRHVMSATTELHPTIHQNCTCTCT